MLVSKNRIRRIITLLFTLVFILQCIPVHLFAEGDADNDNPMRPPVPQGTITVTLTLDHIINSSKRAYTVNLLFTANQQYSKLTIDSFKLYRGPTSSSQVAYTTTGITQNYSPAVFGSSMLGIGVVTITADNNGNYTLYAVTTNAKMKFVNDGWSNIPDLNFEVIHGS